MLPKKIRQRVRDLAAVAYHDAGRDRDRAIELIEKRLKESGDVSSLLFTLALKLAIALIDYWLKNQITDPGAEFKSSEPGA